LARELFNLHALTQLALEEPEFAKAALIDWCAPRCTGFDVETHFTPRYMPWRSESRSYPTRPVQVDQRRAGVDRDRRDRSFHRVRRDAQEREELDADIIVTATGST